jgi:hypothetical protein
LLRGGARLPFGLSLLAVFANVALTEQQARDPARQPASGNGRVASSPAVPA